MKPKKPKGCCKLTKKERIELAFNYWKWSMELNAYFNREFAKVPKWEVTLKDLI